MRYSPDNGSAECPYIGFPFACSPDPKTLFADDLHAKRVLSLAGATLGVIESASLAVAMIGQGLALARGRLTKHAIKQVDRLLSNPAIDVDALLVRWVPYVVGVRSNITVAMDWTDFDADGQTTIMPPLLCRHGRPEVTKRPDLTDKAQLAHRCQNGQPNLVAQTLVWAT